MIRLSHILSKIVCRQGAAWTPLALFLANPSLANAADFKILTGLPFATFTAVTDIETHTGTAPVGILGELAYHITKRAALAAQTEANVDTSSQTLVFFGIGGGLQWYFLGGPPVALDTGIVSLNATPHANIYGYFLLGQKTFNFESYLAKWQGRLMPRTKNDVARGTPLATTVGAAAEMPFENNSTIGLRLQFTKTLPDPSLPSITIIGGALTGSYNL